MRENELEAKLAESLGEDAARAALDALIAEWGGCRLDIPNGTSSRKRRRDNEIRRRYRAGADMYALRGQFGLSDRHLRRILSAAPPILKAPPAPSRRRDLPVVEGHRENNAQNGGLLA